MLRLAIFTFLIFSVSACGGGSGSGSNDNQVKFLRGDFNERFSAGFDVATLGLGLTEAAHIFAEDVVAKILDLSDADTPRTTISCESGGATVVSYQDADGSNNLSVNDQVIVNYQACESELYGATVSGSITVSLLGTDSLSRSTPNLQLAAQTSGLRVVDLTQNVVVDGSMMIAVTTANNIVTLRILDDAEEFAINVGTSREVLSNLNLSRSYNTDSNRYSNFGDVRISSDLAEGFFPLSYVSALRGNDGVDPSTGFLEVRSAEGGFARLGSDNGSAYYFEDTEGDGVQDTGYGFRWGDYIDRVIFENFTFLRLSQTPPSSGGSSSGSDPGSVPAPVAATRVVRLTGNAHDVAFDFSALRAYVSIPTLNAYETLDLGSMTSLNNAATGPEPRGVDLTIDNSRLLVALNQAGSIANIDLASGSKFEINLSEELDDSRAWDVAVINNTTALVTANPSSNGFSYVVKVAFTSAVTNASRVANGRIIRGAPEIEYYPESQFAYVGEGFSPNSIYKIDLAQPNAPIVAEDDHGDVSGSSRISASADGQRLATRSGQILRTSDISQAAKIDGGIPVYSTAGDKIYMGVGSDIVVYSTENFLEDRTVRSDCPITNLQRLSVNSDETVAYLLGEDYLCEVSLQ